ncbi:MAG: sialidase family protein [Verrucomicrobiota bacterium]
MLTSRFRLTCLALLTALTSLVHAAAPLNERQDLFEAGKGGYALYHIPSLLVTTKGTILAWCEARNPGSDWSAIDFVMRRSADDGKTWSEPKTFLKVDNPKPKNPMSLKLKSTNPDHVTYNNCVLISARDGTVHAVFCLEYMRAFYARSTDDGVTWSKPVEITKTFEEFSAKYPWKVLAAGPNHGVQMKSGRLVVPVWISTGTGGNAHRPSVTSTVYSDDAGKTWKAGEIAVPDTPEWINPNEAIGLELVDGRYMLNVRNESKTHRRLVTYSKDGATGWSTPQFDDALLEPICMGSLIRLSAQPQSDKNRILFSNPHNLDREDGKGSPGASRDRKNMTVKLSYDEGKTWAVSKVVEPGHGAYSDLAVTKAGTILLFFGNGGTPKFAGSKLSVVRFNLEWLTDGKDALKK